VTFIHILSGFEIFFNFIKKKLPGDLSSLVQQKTDKKQFDFFKKKVEKNSKTIKDLQ